MLMHSSGSYRAPSRPQWTDAHIARFWDYESRRADQSKYFTQQVGSAIAWIAGEEGLLRGNLLDYGCGAGHLIPHLLRPGVSVEGVDFSSESVDAVNERFEGEPHWRGAIHIGSLPTPLPAAHYDLIFCLETLEHLRPETMQETLRELRRLMRPGGALFITVPFNEDLQKQFVYCPFCDAEFHRWQHQASFTIEDMRHRLVSQDFDVAFCRQSDLYELTGRLRLPDGTVAGLRSRLAHGRARFQQLLDVCLPRPPFQSRLLQSVLDRGPNLCAIAIRR